TRGRHVWPANLPAQRKKSKSLQDNLRRKLRGASFNSLHPLATPREKLNETRTQRLPRPCCVRARLVFRGGCFRSRRGREPRRKFHRNDFQVDPLRHLG